MTSNTQHSEEERAEALFRRLSGEEETSGALPAEESALADELRQTAQEIKADPKFRAALGARLFDPAQATLTQPHPTAVTGLAAIWRALRGPWRSLATAAPILLVTVILVWAIRNLRPVQVPSIGSTETSAPAIDPTRQIDNSVSPAAPTATPLPPPTATPDYPVFSSPHLPDSPIVLAAEYPANPDQVQLYSQVISEGELTTDTAINAAKSMGVVGKAYVLPGGELAGQSILMVTDGIQRITFLDSPDHFTYVSDSTTNSDRAGAALLFEQASQIASDFLRQRGLLDFEYQAFPSKEDAYTINFIARQDGLPVRFSGVNSPQITVWVGSDGLVKTVIYRRLRFNPVASLPIITAEQAWQAFLDGAAPQGVETYTAGSFAGDFQTWSRSYPSNQVIDLYGYAEIFPAAEGGSAPYISLNNYPVVGDLTALASQWEMGVFLHARGQLQPQPNGSLAFVLDSWEISSIADETFPGTLAWQGSEAIFTPDPILTGLTTSMLLPDLPLEVPAGPAYVRGVRLPEEPGLMQWSSIQTGDIASGGGGGGGGGNFADISPTPSSSPPREPIPTLPALPYQAGDSIDSLEGTVSVYVYPNPDGSQRREIQFYVDDPLNFPGGLLAILEGDALAGIETYNWLPVRISGTFSQVSTDRVTISVDLYEPVDPDLRYQAWLGTYAPVTLEGRQVLLFTTLQGESFVLGPSIEFDPDSDSGKPGDRVIIEGWLRNDSFGGYPVIEERSSALANEYENLDGYEITSDDPVFIDDQAGAKAGRLTIDAIELIYLTPDLSHGGGYDPSAVFYAQPVWRFSGVSENGNPAEIYVQALTAEYLR